MLHQTGISNSGKMFGIKKYIPYQALIMKINEVYDGVDVY